MSEIHYAFDETKSRSDSSKRFWARKCIEAMGSDGVRIAEFSELSGISEDQLRQWVRQYQSGEYERAVRDSLPFGRRMKSR